MKLHEIIKANEVTTNSILIELLLPYKKSLLTYYKSIYPCEPVLMVTDVFNAAQYGRIAPSDDFSECISMYLEGDDDLSAEDRADAHETISFDSIMLKDL